MTVETARAISETLCDFQERVLDIIVFGQQCGGAVLERAVRVGDGTQQSVHIVSSQMEVGVGVYTHRVGVYTHRNPAASTTMIHQHDGVTEKRRERPLGHVVVVECSLQHHDRPAIESECDGGFHAMISFGRRDHEKREVARTMTGRVTHHVTDISDIHAILCICGHGRCSERDIPSTDERIQK